MNSPFKSVSNLWVNTLEKSAFRLKGGGGAWEPPKTEGGVTHSHPQ